MPDYAELLENLDRLAQWCRAKDPNATIWLHIPEAAEAISTLLKERDVLTQMRKLIEPGPSEEMTGWLRYRSQVPQVASTMKDRTPQELADELHSDAEYLRRGDYGDLNVTVGDIHWRLNYGEALFVIEALRLFAAQGKPYGIDDTGTSTWNIAMAEITTREIVGAVMVTVPVAALLLFQFYLVVETVGIWNAVGVVAVGGFIAVWVAVGIGLIEYAKMKAIPARVSTTAALAHGSADRSSSFP